MGAKSAICFKGEERGGEWRECKENKNGGEQDVPREDWHPEHGHTRSAHHKNGGDEVDATKNRAYPTDGKSYDPQVATYSG